MSYLEINNEDYLRLPRGFNHHFIRIEVSVPSSIPKKTIDKSYSQESW
jgi:hypothetical protein